jgi:hypothetical protein
MAIGGNSVVEQSPRHPKIKGLSRTRATNLWGPLDHFGFNLDIQGSNFKVLHFRLGSWVYPHLLD